MKIMKKIWGRNINSKTISVNICKDVTFLI